MKAKNPQFPILLKTEVLREPQASVYYEVAANGFFQIRDTAIYQATTLAALPLPGLLPTEEQLRLRFPPLPASQIEKVIAFFHAVYRSYQGEAVVIIFYHPDRRKFKVGVPPQVLRLWCTQAGQWISHQSVTYGHVARPSGYMRLGTIHSHASIAAFSSQIDQEDEQFEDGLHIVFGNFGSNQLSVAASFVANAVRFPLDPASVLEPYAFPTQQPPPEWMAKVEYEKAGWETSQVAVGSFHGCDDRDGRNSREKGHVEKADEKRQGKG